MATHSHAVVTRFLILSDTHNFESETAEGCPLKQQMPRVDVLLHCGDLTQIGGLSAYKGALRMLEPFDAELKLVIAGNHDISLDGEYWRAHLEDDDEPKEHDQVVAIMTGPLALKANTTTFTIFVSPYQPECGEWAFGYQRGERIWQIPEGVDIVVTHGPPKGILDFARNETVGCEALFQAVERSRPLMHCFGHIHEGYGTENRVWEERNDEAAERCTASVSKAGVEDVVEDTVTLVRGKSTLTVNAAIMDEHNKPANAPWLVELPLRGSKLRP
ncbi:hypothetical protein LTR36_010663 [Oleoguttula mirabilis]|uniref:Calcineurin-like phosphoesterase domain-containing protein n=1 Tax=Oleoguttula mirabilis TaxID=1507867 RepID=A0AAV9JR57_9PEZI|nr:hypothetical protein LTR36_010663 [Oleoguttula mirabilis]